jgi:phosphatidylinositol alpha-1,6-mannosyltransferase
LKQALILVWEFPPGPGGIGQHAYSVAVALHKKGYQVKVITSADYGTKEEILSFDRLNGNIEIIRLQGLRIIKYLKRVVYSVWAVLTQRKGEIIFSGKGALWLIPLLKLFASSGNRLSVFVHGSEAQLPGRVSRNYTHYCITFAHKIWCVSNFTKTLLPKKIRHSPYCDVLINGLTTDEMPTEMPVIHPKIKSIGSPKLLTVGQLTRRKGQHRVILVLPKLKERWPDIHYHMVGLDTERASLLKLADSLGVLNNVTIHGRMETREELYKAYASADIFMMLSENQSDGDVEGFGIAILEANYFGMPAIGAVNCGIEDAIAEGKNGFLVDGNDVEAILKAVESCLKNHQDMQGAMRHWINQHNWDQLIEKFLV